MVEIIDAINESTLIKDYRISESSRINSETDDFDIRVLDRMIGYHSDSMSIVPIEQLRNKYILLFSQTHCSSCIDEAITRYQKLLHRLDYCAKDWYIIGSHDNPTAFRVFVHNFGVHNQNILFSKNIGDSFVGDEEVPILIKIDSTGKVKRACFLDKYLPDSFYDAFFRKNKLE